MLHIIYEVGYYINNIPNKPTYFNEYEQAYLYYLEKLNTDKNTQNLMIGCRKDGNLIKLEHPSYNKQI